LQINHNVVNNFYFVILNTFRRDARSILAQCVSAAAACQWHQGKKTKKYFPLSGFVNHFPSQGGHWVSHMQTTRKLSNRFR